MSNEGLYPADFSKYPTQGPLTQKRRRYLEFLRRHWWIPLLTTAVTLCGTAIYLKSQPPSFVSTASLYVSGKLNLQQGAVFAEESQLYYGTHIKILESQMLHEQVFENLRVSRPELVRCPIRLQVSQAGRSAVFSLAAFGPDPVFVQAFLDSLIKVYLNYKKQVRDDSSDTTYENILRELETREKSLAFERAKIAAFQHTNNVALLQEESNNARASLSRLNTELYELRIQHDLLDIGSAANQSPNDSVSSTNANAQASPTQIGNSALVGIQNPSPQVLEASRKLEELKRLRNGLSELKPAHPKILKLDEEIRLTQEVIQFYQSQNREQLANTKRSYKEKIDRIEASVQEWEQKLSVASGYLAEYERLQNNVEGIRGVYDRLSTLLDTVNVTKNLDQEIVRTMNHASKAGLADAGIPRKLGIATLAGLLAGLAIVFLVERLDDRFTSMNEVLEQFDEEIIGQVPDVPRGRSKKRIALVQANDDRHMFAESYRNIRSSLLFMAVEGERPKTLLITSGVPNEGKSTVAANLARTMAFAGTRVLLVDADLRKGTQHELFGVPREPGLSELLRKASNWREAIVKTELPTLFLIPSDDYVENASELFLSADFERFLHEAREEFDCVLLDSPPVFAADDATTLAPKIDGVIFVTRGSFTRAHLARQALDLLYQRQAKVLGLIYNRANTANRSYYYYKYADYYRSSAKRTKSKAV